MPMRSPDTEEESEGEEEEGRASTPDTTRSSERNRCGSNEAERGKARKSVGWAPETRRGSPKYRRGLPEMASGTQKFIPRTPFETEESRFVGCHAATRPKATLAEEWDLKLKMPKAFKKIKAEFIGVKRAAEYRLFDRL